MRISRTLIALIGVLTAVLGCSAAHGSPSAANGCYLGVYEPGTPESYQPIDSFAAAIHHQPNIALYYSGWWEGFQVAFARKAYARGATVIVQIDPTNIDMNALASGQYDSYITSFAQSVRAYGHQTIIGFGHEMNGSWYTWAWKHSSPAAWILAWQHIVNIFRQAGADNVIWMWTITKKAPSTTGPIKEWWPGASYVDWIGIDGYYYTKSDTFQSVFGPTISDVRKLTNDPILLSEAGIGQISGQAAKLPGLFAGVKKDGLLGVVWFDVEQDDGVYAQDWRVEGHHAAIVAFQRAAGKMNSC